MSIEKSIDDCLFDLLGHTKKPKPSSKSDEEGIIEGEYLTDIPILNLVAQSPIFNGCSKNNELIHRYSRNNREFIAVGERLNFRCFKLYLAVMKSLNFSRGDNFTILSSDFFKDADVSKSNLSRKSYVDGLIDDLSKLARTYLLVYETMDDGKKKLINYFRLIGDLDTSMLNCQGTLRFEFDNGLFKAFESTNSKKSNSNELERWTAFKPEIFGEIRSEYAKFLFAYYFTYTSSRSKSFSKRKKSLIKALGIQVLPVKEQNKHLKNSHEVLKESGLIEYKVKPDAGGNDLYQVRVVRRS